jgi:hypothetical protein
MLYAQVSNVPFRPSSSSTRGRASARYSASAGHVFSAPEAKTVSFTFGLYRCYRYSFDYK